VLLHLARQLARDLDRADLGLEGTRERALHEAGQLGFQVAQDAHGGGGSCSTISRGSRRGTGRAWALPAAAPLLGLAALAVAFPALAGRARGAWQRAALGAAGLWWLLLAEALLDRRLLFGGRPAAGWERDAGRALDGVLAPPLTSGLVAVAAVWAVAALALPWLVRGRSAAADFVAASAWAAGLGSGTGAVAEWAGAGAPHGLVAGAVVAGGLALAVPRLLPRDIVERDLPAP